MKQLYYTSCLPGRSMGGHSGFQVRAISPGVATEHRQATERYLSYSLPQGIRPDENTVHIAPVRLALVQTPDAGRLLYHSVYVGRDPATQRFGNYFSHALIDVPPEIGVSHGMRSWGSKFWQRQDGDTESTLEDVFELPNDGHLNLTGLRTFLAVDGNRQLLKFLLDSLFTSSAERRVFLVAPAESIAWCIYGLTLTVTESLLQNFTFSTYESDPLSTYARVVGTWWDANRAPSQTDLPSSCYDRSGLAFNSITGRRSNSSRNSPYAEFAVESLATGQSSRLQPFLVSRSLANIDSMDSIDLAFKLSQPADRLSTVDLRDAMQNPSLFSMLLESNGQLSWLVKAVVDDATLQGPQVIQALPRPRQHELLKCAIEEIVLSISRDQLARAQRCCDQILVPLQATRRADVWKDIATAVPEPQRLSINTRLWFLQSAAQLIDNEPCLLRWLSPGLGELTTLLDLKLPDHLRQRICLACLEQSDDIRSEFEPVIRKEGGAQLVIDLLHHISQKSSRVNRHHTNEQIAQELFLLAWSAANDRRFLIGLLIGNECSFPTSVRISPPVVRCMLEVVEETSANDASLLQYLNEVSTHPSLDQALRAHAKRLLDVRSFLARPDLNAARLQALGKSINSAESSQQIRNSVMNSVATVLSTDAGAGNVVNQILTVLQELAPAASEAKFKYFESLVESLSRQGHLWVQVALLEALLQVSLEIAPVEFDANQKTTDHFIGLARQIAGNTRWKGGKAAFEQLQARSARWSTTTRQRWTAIVKKDKLDEPHWSIRLMRSLWRGTKKTFQYPEVYLIALFLMAMLYARQRTFGGSYFKPFWDLLQLFNQFLERYK